jgi:hypothetical protein
MAEQRFSSLHTSLTSSSQSSLQAYGNAFYHTGVWPGLMGAENDFPMFGDDFPMYQTNFLKSGIFGSPEKVWTPVLEKASRVLDSAHGEDMSVVGNS